MKIQEKISKFITWCDHKEITLFKGEINHRKKIITLIWEDDNIDAFLKFVSKVSPKILGYHEFVANGLSNDIALITKTTENAEQVEEILGKYNEFKKYQNTPLEFSIYFIQEGALYKFIHLSEHINEYVDLIKLLEKYNKSIESIEVSKPHAEYISRAQKLEPYAQKLAEHEDFVRSNGDIQFQCIVVKNVFGDNFFESLGFDIENNINYKYTLQDTLCKLATKYYNENILPIKERELVKKIREMKKNGAPKVSIAAKLDISVDKLNRLIYKYEE